jgi:hypothetical protein
MGECFVRCGAPSNNWSILDFTSEQVCIFNKLYQVYITKRRREEQLNGEAFIRAEVCSEAVLTCRCGRSLAAARRGGGDAPVLPRRPGCLAGQLHPGRTGGSVVTGTL